MLSCLLWFMFTYLPLRCGTDFLFKDLAEFLSSVLRRRLFGRKWYLGLSKHDLMQQAGGCIFVRQTETEEMAEIPITHIESCVCICSFFKWTKESPLVTSSAGVVLASLCSLFFGKNFCDYGNNWESSGNILTFSALWSAFMYGWVVNLFGASIQKLNIKITACCFALWRKQYLGIWGLHQFSVVQ